MSKFLKLDLHPWGGLNGPGVVAVSGGADSVALLRLLKDAALPVSVAHLNHRLRGAASDADEQFVVQLARSLGLQCRSTAIDILTQARLDGANLEETARKIRYEWLEQVAVEHSAAWIATGHTADDQAETVLHRLLRGAGVQGLRGIARERISDNGIRIVRPLLHIERRDLLAYLAAINQAWREDETNRDPAFTRNRIRRELLPMLSTFNPAIRETLTRLAEQADEIYTEEQRAAKTLLHNAELPAAGTLRIFQTAILQAAAPAQLRGMFRALWEREGWPCQDMTYEHWKRAAAIVFGNPRAADFPGGVTCRSRGSVLQIGREG